MRRVSVLAWLALSGAAGGAYAATFDIKSPNGRLSAIVTVDKAVTYEIAYAGRRVIDPSRIGLELSRSDGSAAPKGEITIARRESNAEVVVTVPRKRRVLQDQFNELKVDLGDRRSVCFRAYDEAIAYRWETTIEDRIRIDSERATFSLPEDAELWFSREDSVVSPQEPSYERVRVSQVGSSDLA